MTDDYRLIAQIKELVNNGIRNSSEMADSTTDVGDRNFFLGKSSAYFEVRHLIDTYFNVVANKETQ